MKELERRACLAIVANKAVEARKHTEKPVKLSYNEFMALWKLIKDAQKRLAKLENGEK